MKNLSKFLIASSSAAGLLALSAGGIFRFVFYSPQEKQNDDYNLVVPFRTEEERNQALELIGELNARPFEPVSIRSFDGLRLSGRYYHSENGAPLCILCHGYRGTPSRDFCGGAKLCLQAGYNVLLIEERAHCTSEGHTISFGINERYDVLAWLRYAVERFGADVRILLAGISMGAATVLMASELDLPRNVLGILADCPYSSPEAIIRKVGKEHRIPMALAFPLVRIGAKLFGGFSLSSSDSVSAVRNARIPILLIHGEADAFVPCDMSREIAAANPAMVEFHTFPGAGHGLSYLVDTPRYTQLVEEFCRKVFSGL